MAKSRQAAGKRTAPLKFGFYWRMMADPVLSASAKCVAAALLFKFHNVQTGRCNPSVPAIGRVIGRTGRAVFPAIIELRDCGWITVESTHGGSSNHTNQYRFDFERVQSERPAGMKPASPPGMKPTSPVKQNAGGMKPTSYEPLKTARPSGGGWGEEKTSPRAPDGALEKFEELRQVWQRPYGTNVVKALAAFHRVTGDGVAPELILESARRWVAVKDAAFLPKLETWLDDGAWRNEPPVRRSNNSHHRPSAAEVAAGLAADAERDDDGGWS